MRWGRGNRVRASLFTMWLILSWLCGVLAPLPASRADNFYWLQLFFDDLEKGSEHWMLGAGWHREEDLSGNHYLVGRGAGSATLDSSVPWQDHRLILRLQLLAGALQLHLRQSPSASYTLTLGETQIILTRRDASGVHELAEAAIAPLSAGWHTLSVTLYEDHVMVTIDQTPCLDYLDLGLVGAGQLALQTDDGSVAYVDDIWITGVRPLPETPPAVERIRVQGVDGRGEAAIIGAAGAVPAGATVYLVNVETLDWVCTVADGQGGFAASLFAPEGSTLQINYGYPGALSRFESIGLEGSPAILISVPLPPTAPGELSFAVGERLVNGHWVARGSLPAHPCQPGEMLPITMTWRLDSPQVPALDLDAFRLSLRLAWLRLFDEAGQQLPATRNLVSALLTPSGLAVEAELEVANPWLLTQHVAGAEMVRQGSALTATLTISLPIPADLPAGIYRPRLKVACEEAQGASWQPIQALCADDDLFMLERQDARREYPWPLLAPVRIGDPASPRLGWSLFSDYVSNSERGVRAQESDHYALSPRTVFPTNCFVLPPVNGHTGEPVSYALEPSLPLTSWGFRPLYERVLVDPPVLPLAYPAGHVRVRVTRPDGVEEELGSFGFVSGLNPLMMYRPDEADPSRHHRSLISAFDNPGPGDYYRAWTGDERLRYTFTRYGKYTIRLEGEMADLWGNVYEAGGTYEVWVAQPLDLETGTLLGMPFEVGDAYAPVVRVQPAVPAEITVELSLYINSSQENVWRRRLAGRANRFGYYHPGAEVLPLTFPAPGEYDVLITATYRDPQGVLWMGAVRGANVIETPQTPLIAHGERGIRSFAAVKRPAWFAEGYFGNVVPGQTDGLFDNRTLGGALHLPYPYYIGDVMWVVDREGENSIFPAITFQDTQGVVADLLAARVPEVRQGAYYYGQFPVQLLPLDRRAIGELPLVTTTGTGAAAGQTYGWPVGQYPTLADQIGYFYSACMRPDLPVACHVAESGLGNAYWFADDNYNLQPGQGTNGDLTPDFKINLGGLVFRDLAHGVNQYAIYNSCDVYIPEGQPDSNRITPPYRGAAGGQDGGPLMTLQGRDIDLFVHPTGVKPGSVLEVGDVLSFSAQVVPTLASHVTVTITMPSGKTHLISGVANKVGYFYQPEDDLIVDEIGIYRVQVKGVHRGMTSVGPVYSPYPEGDILGTTDGVFDVYVVPRDTAPLSLEVWEEDGEGGTRQVADGEIVRPAQPLEVRGQIPAGWDDAQARYTVSLSGFVLQQGVLETDEVGRFVYRYEPLVLHEEFPNLDVEVIPPYLSFIPWREPEAVDTVQINLFVTGQCAGRLVARARAITLQGVQLQLPAVMPRQSSRYLPLIKKG